MSPSLSSGTKLGRYEIRSKIGAGGMGEVYLAQDTKLDRKVALKILPAEVASNRDRMERFVREAKSAAALNHPNIAHVYEIGESAETHFIAMEFVDGQTLREKIHRDRAPLAKLLKYLIQVAEGLSKAHAAGIVHRDLKPDNIMITRDDYAKVLDFGLAKLVEPQRTFESGQVGSSEIATAIMQQQSIPGMVMGTIGYMSPEQASGRVNEIDHRSDIFSFGCILFEAATGQRAFEGKDPLDSLHKIVHAPTPQLKDVNPLAPDDLQRVVRRCLAKEPEKRYQSMKEVALEIDDLQQELKGLAGAEYSSSAASSTKVTTSGATRADKGFWVAVLPFKARDADPSVAALADGLSEEIVTGLSRFRYLSVVTSASAARLKGETGDERALGVKLGARYGLQGSISKGGSVIRVSAQLVDTETGAQLWSETYNRDLQTSTIFAVQDDIAGRIVATVADSYGVLVHSMRAAIRQKDDADLTPVEWQFQYCAYREQITPSALAALKSRLLRVAERNDGQSNLWACLAQIYVDEYAFGFQGDATSLDRALAAGRRGVELDRANQFALVALAQVHFFRQDLAAFGPAAERAMALNPLNTDALGILGLQIVHTGEFERGTAIVRRAMELNPNHAGWMHFAPLWEHFHKGEYEQALECANRVDVPGLFWPYLVMASACGHLGRRPEAEAAVRDLLALDPEFAVHVRSNVGSWHFASGLMDPILEGLRKAGLEIRDEEPASSSSAAPLASSETRADEGFWVAVLPFRYSGGNADLIALTEGLSEDIVTGLSRFSYLRVITRSSTMRLTGEAADVRTVGKELGARYVMEGSLRLAGSLLRVAVQLVDASNGAHLWAETYDRPFRPEEIFAIQDDLVPRIVSTVADTYGVLPHSICEALRGRKTDELRPYEVLMRFFDYTARFSPESHAETRASLEQIVQKVSSPADCWSMLSDMYADEYKFGFNPQPDPLGRALGAAQRAVDLAPSNSFAHFALAQVLFFRKDFEAFRTAAERALALNPMDGGTAAYMGNLMAFTGDWEKGCQLIERATQMNPHHPGWYWTALVHREILNGDFREALNIALRMNMPGFLPAHIILAAVYGQLGDHRAADKARQELLALMPEVDLIARDELSKWYLPDLIEHLIDGLRKAGLEIPDVDGAATSSSAGSASGQIRSDEGFWVAVLPFRSSGTSLEVKSLAEGLSEDIITGLSRFSYLRVIARGSTLHYANQTTDLREVGKELGARYVMEGNLRQAGTKLRITVQLVDAINGAHLWAENYERSFSPESVFELQDELVPRIVSTVADLHGVLPHSMSEVVRLKPPDQLSPYEAVLRSFGYTERVTAEELADALACLELAVQKVPSYPDALAMLASYYTQDHGQGFDLRTDPLVKGENLARKVVEIAPSNHLAWISLAQVHFFQKEFQTFTNAAERAVALNPMDGNSMATLGEMLTFSGNWERGLELVERAQQLNPNHPGWYWYVNFHRAYQERDYESALDFALKVNLPSHWVSPATIAAASGQLGQREAAAKAVRDMLKLRPEVASTVRMNLEKWWTAEDVEHFIEGLRKAGLQIPGEERRVEAAAPTEKRAAVEPSRSIAVLPFANISNDKENEYFCDGLAEELLNALAKIDELKVAARTSAFSFKGKNVNASEISRFLGVNTVLEGSVRKAGDRVRITVQLINAADGYHLWSERYDREMKDIFEVQDEITLAVVATLRLKLLGAEKAAVLKRHTDNPEAYQLYLKGRFFVNQRTSESLRKAIEYFNQAISVDANYALGYAGLTDAYMVLGVPDAVTEALSPRDSLPKARAAAEKALQIDNSVGEIYPSLAHVKWKERDWAGAAGDYDRGLKLNPNYPIAHFYYAVYLASLGRRNEAVKEIRRAQALDPLSAPVNATVTFVCYLGRQYDEAIEAGKKALEMDAAFPLTHQRLGLAYVQKRMYPEAIAEFQQAANYSNRAPQAIIALGHAYAVSGNRVEAQNVLVELNEMSQGRYVSPYGVAVIYVGLGDQEQAFQWLERANDERNTELTFLKVDPRLDPLRGDPRFHQLLRRVGIPQ